MQTPTSRTRRLLRRWPLLLVALADGLRRRRGAADDAADARAGGDASSRRDRRPACHAEEMKYGIGPIRDLDLEDEIDDDLVAAGQEIFTTKCSACHKLDERYVGPPLGGVTERREPEYVMNMILNTDEMVARHPEVKELLAQYYTPMPDQQLTEEDARAVLEYLRVAGPGPAGRDGASARPTTAETS